MTSIETLIDRIDGFIDSLDEHVTHEDMANALASLREFVRAGCQHDWQNRVSGGSKCRNCNVWQDKRVFEKAHAKKLATSPEHARKGADSLHVPNGYQSVGTPHAPTDDEREALATALDAVHDDCVTEGGCEFRGWLRGWRTGDRAVVNTAVVDPILAALGRPVAPEPQGESSFEPCAALCGDRPCSPACAERGTQGEPSDARVEAALQALGHARSAVTTPLMRAALRAAGGV